MRFKAINFILRKINTLYLTKRTELRRLLNKFLVSNASSKFFRYKVRKGAFDRPAVEKWCKEVNEYYAQQGDLQNSFTVYQNLVTWLSNAPDIEVRPMSMLMDGRSEGKAIVALRHDIDADISTALRAAIELDKHGLPGTFYFLHTTMYYGYFEDFIFHRQPAMTSFIRDFLKTDCEIGLHTDPLSIYCEHKTDGANAVKTEIEWLRNQGVNIKGTVAHNSAPLYGAENFEIFKNRSVGDRNYFSYKEENIPLQVLDEKKLGLSYEGNYPLLHQDMHSKELIEYLAGSINNGIRDKSWQEKYFITNPVFDRLYETSIWLLSRDAWVIAVHNKTQSLRWPVTTEMVIEFLSEAKAGERIVINIHPEYIAG